MNYDDGQPVMYLRLPSKEEVREETQKVLMAIGHGE